eukprot:693231-Pyramimonas_sp.AAC.1
MHCSAGNASPDRGHQPSCTPGARDPERRSQSPDGRQHMGWGTLPGPAACPRASGRHPGHGRLSRPRGHAQELE